MHGGAKGSGGQPGNSNALKHGLRTRAHMDRMRAYRQLIGEAEELLAVVHRS